MKNVEYSGESIRKSVSIIGAGPSGLTAAFYLKSAGF